MTTLCPPTIATFTTYGPSQTPHLMKHFICFRAPKTENETLAGIRARVSRRKGPQPKTFLRGAGGNLPVGQPWRKRDYQVHTGLRAQDLYLGAELFPECLSERIAALRVQVPGLPDVPREMTSAYKIRERRLIQE
jgi:hypothetical protein